MFVRLVIPPSIPCIKNRTQIEKPNQITNICLVVKYFEPENLVMKTNFNYCTATRLLRNCEFILISRMKTRSVEGVDSKRRLHAHFILSLSTSIITNYLKRDT